MEPILRAAVVYIFLLIVLRLSGARTLGDMTKFDFVLLLIIGDASQQAITSNDYSVINTILIVVTLVLVDVGLTFLKVKYHFVDRVIDGSPLILVSNGKLLKSAMKKVKIGEEDILESARVLQGLERMDQIKFAILEKDGDISIIPKKAI